MRDLLWLFNQLVCGIVRIVGNLSGPLRKLASFVRIALFVCFQLVCILSISVLGMIGRKVLKMTIREFISNDTIFNIDDIRIDTLDSNRDHLLLFQGSWYKVDALKYLDCKIITFYHDFQYDFTAFVIEL